MALMTVRVKHSKIGKRYTPEKLARNGLSEEVRRKRYAKKGDINIDYRLDSN